MKNKIRKNDHHSGNNITEKEPDTAGINPLRPYFPLRNTPGTE